MHTNLFQKASLPAQTGQYPGCLARPEHLAWVWVESNDGGYALKLRSGVDRHADDPPVPQVDTIEGADGYDSGPVRYSSNLLKRSVDPHYRASGSGKTTRGRAGSDSAPGFRAYTARRPSGPNTQKRPWGPVSSSFPFFALTASLPLTSILGRNDKACGTDSTPSPAPPAGRHQESVGSGRGRGRCAVSSTGLVVSSED